MELRVLGSNVDIQGSMRSISDWIKGWDLILDFNFQVNLLKYPWHDNMKHHLFFWMICFRLFISTLGVVYHLKPFMYNWVVDSLKDIGQI